MSTLVRIVLMSWACAAGAAGQSLRLSAPVPTPLGAAPEDVLVADVSGDGHADLLVAHDAPPSISVLLNDGAGAFGAPVLTALPGIVRAWCTGDLDGDGHADVVLIDDTSHTLRALLGQPSGSLSAGGSLDLGSYPNTRGLATLDANHDSRLDVALNTWGGVSLAKGDGLGGFQALGPQFTPSTNDLLVAGDLFVSDVNADGHDDLITAAYYVWGTGFMVFAGDGAAQFSDHTQSPLSVDASPYGYAVGDLDADGRDDVAHTFYDYFLFWDTCNGAVGLGDGHSVEADYPDDVVMFLQQAQAWLQIADFDGDGYGDLLGLNGGYSAGPVVLNRSDGLGAFAPPLFLSQVGLATRYAVGDLDHFGADDLVLVDRAQAQLAVVLNRTPLPGISDVGGALAGRLGEPRLAATGTLLGGAPVTLALDDALPLASTILVFGLSELSLPFKGGLLVPQPDLLIDGLLTSTRGELDFSGTWPAGLPAGFSTWWQYWIVDAGGPAGLAASNGLVLKSGPE